ncbi:uncharacterized protein LOC110041286 [Orbicella faveolata]|uniref:uncharacterized protein LOC110041286 n=1 Tax=Orbicella faveolata TaxID=48498 RepID=UPI0009E21A72|nr:uncharacterized protein LOC110041286 [Orbicella faveolata]
MRSFVIVVILGFLATIAVAASTKRDPQSTNQWRPGKKDDTNLSEDRYEEDSSYESSPLNEWNLDDVTSQVLGDQGDFKGIPPEFPRPGRKRSNFDVSYYSNFPADEYSRGLGNFRLIRPGRKRRSLVA